MSKQVTFTSHVACNYRVVNYFLHASLTTVTPVCALCVIITEGNVLKDLPEGDIDTFLCRAKLCMAQRFHCNVRSVQP